MPGSPSIFLDEDACESQAYEKEVAKACPRPPLCSLCLHPLALLPPPNMDFVLMGLC